MLETMEPLELPPQRIHREKAMARARVEPAPSSSAHPSSSRTEQPFRPVSHHRNLGTTESSAAMPPPHYSSAATSFAPPHPLGRPQHERTPSASSTSSSIHHPSRPASAAASHTELATNAQPNSRLGPARVPVSAGPPSGSKPGPRRVVTAPFRPVSKAHDGPDGGNEVRVRPTRGPPQRIALPPKPVPKPAPAPAPQPAPTKVLKRALSQATLSQAKVKSARTIPSSTSAPPSETSATPTSKADDVLSASVSSTTSQPSVSSNAPKSATSEPTAGTTSTTTATAAGAPAATAPSAPNRPRRPGAPPGFVPKRERTAGGATGATASQLAKMRPPVQRNAAASKAPKGADHASASSKKEKAPVVDPVLAVAVNTPLPGDKSEGKTDGTATADATAREGVKRAEGEIQARPAEELELASAAPVPAAPPAVTTTSLIDLSFTFECLAIGPTSVESDEQKKPSALLELEGLEFTPSASVGSKEIVPEDGARPVLGERKINVDAGAVQPSINGPLFSF
ncbi:hypothetical protein BOTBODRAFT_196171 [Botryobasidium botryosum FD-172 SS1]|uniref:Uncharacterized protein n=1 Tax=Botryobasidium botryosum (strain FD-172 SS1) TaxID=930990 RepID=A0A067MZR1_BOTB1|nr:hypothetical protein BOTBODRAFT_196171 [Botryobasidium botryosum FD-172 SS1]